MMGKSLELLGLASFNVFLGLVLSVTFLNNDGDKTPSRLTETSVSAFVQEMNKIRLGQNPETDSYAVTEWLMEHIDETSKFIITSNLTPLNGMPIEEKSELGRMEYISNALKEMKAIQARESNLNIEYVKIDETGMNASVIYTNMEKGNVPYNNEGTEVMMPVAGTSYCEQKVTLRDKVIVVTDTTCTSHVSIAQTY